MQLLPANFKLTTKERNLVRAIRDGKSEYAASVEAGYADEIQAHEMLQAPQVQAALVYELQRKLIIRLVPKALKHYDKVLSDPLANNADKNAAARDVLARAGFVPPKAPENPQDLAKDIGEMNTAELREVVRKGEQVLAGRATDITPGDAPNLDDLSEFA